MSRLLQTDDTSAVLQTDSLSYILLNASDLSQSAAGSLTFSGAPVKDTGKQVAGALTFAGAVKKAVALPVSGALTFAGAVVKNPGKALSGALTFAGAIVRNTGKQLAGALTFTGALESARRIARKLRTRVRDLALAAQKRFRTGEAHTASSGDILLVDGTSYLLQTDDSSKLNLQAAYTPYVTKARPRKKLLAATMRT